MISPACQGRIQIEITNACPHRCSNCTRHTDHVRRPFFMDMPTFQAAVNSMHGYQGLLGIMGGEPTLHPQFAQLVDYYREHWHPRADLTTGRKPIEDFAAYQATWLGSDRTPTKRGLWSSLGPGFYRHMERIFDTFGYLCVNDHRNPAKHQAMLITRRELGIPAAEWIKLRDDCWVQRLWSAAINPRGAWFCEIAASMAMLYGDLPDCPGPRQGWPIEAGWWRREPADFGEQLQWCEVCAGALEVPVRLASEEIQDVSPFHLRLLTAVDSPAVRVGRVAVFEPGCPPGTGLSAPASRNHSNWYMPASHAAKRVARANRSLHPKGLEVLTVCVDYGDYLQHLLPANVAHADRYVIVTASHDAKTQEIAEACGATLVVSDACYANGDAFNKARMLNEGLKQLKGNDWVLLTDADILLPAGLREQLFQLILNPGCLYYTRRLNLPHRTAGDILPQWCSFADPREACEYTDPSTNFAPWGYFQLFNAQASAIRGPRGIGSLHFPECFASAGSVDAWFQHQWPASKKIPLPADGRFDVIHVPHGALGAGWNGKRPPGQGWRYAGQTNILTQYPDPETWDRPCLVRRIRLQDLETTTDFLDAGQPYRIVAPSGDAVYEYSIRPFQGKGA